MNYTSLYKHSFLHASNLCVFILHKYLSKQHPLGFKPFTFIFTLSTHHEPFSSLSLSLYR